MVASLTDKQIQHLYWRAGFGITPKELKKVQSYSKKKLIDHLFEQSNAVKPLYVDLGILKKNPEQLTKDEKKEFRKLQNQKVLEMNTLWFQQMQKTEGILREKMTLFFQNHFSVRLRMPQIMLHFHNTIRKHALGNFGEMLMEVSKSPAMIRYLNNRQNRKGSPNENFAREVMELFTLGRDNKYTETDIKEAARAFTGWDFDKQFEFVFRKNRHDTGVKTVLGKTGNFNGEDIITILLKEQQTANYITEKIYRFIVNDSPDPKNIKTLAKAFYESNYDIESLLRDIFMSKWFYDQKNIGVKIKSPVDLITGLGRQFNTTYEKPKALFFIQRKLNQMLFYPPNVAGWPGGRYWVDSSTLMIRLKLGSIILNNGVIDIDIKDDMPENRMIQKKSKKTGLAKRIRATGDWNAFLPHLNNTSKKDLVDFLIQPQLSETAQKIIAASKNDNTQEFIVELLSLPEYQLC